MQKKKQCNRLEYNYRPMTCLPLKGRILIGYITKKIHDSLQNLILLLVEKNEYSTGTKGTNDLRCIYHEILRQNNEKNPTIIWKWRI